jgi:predicted ABC-type transport system involved in lysophospholipase L1 biosynthesis ATPase subunit
VSLARLSRNERAALRRRAIRYIFQDFNLLPPTIGAAMPAGRCKPESGCRRSST